MNRKYFKQLVAAITLLLVPALSWSADEDHFYVYTVEGAEVRFKVISESEKTCQLEKGPTHTNYSGSITIPSSPNGYTVTSIGNSVFLEYHGLISVTIPEGVKSIGNRAFEQCTSLTSINIPESVTNIGEGAFSECISLPVENGIRYAGTCAFGVVDNTQTTYTLREGTKFLVDTFYGCTELRSVTLPSSLKTIGNRTFCKCSNLTSISIPESVANIGEGAFWNCAGLTSITIPEGVTSIEPQTFHGCTGLTSFTVPSGVMRIGNYAFWGCRNLTSITIPESVTSIGNSAFDSCAGLTSVYCFNNTPPATDQEIFPRKIKQNATLYVPEAALDAYKTDENWTFTNIVGLSDEDIQSVDKVCGIRNGMAGIYSLDGKSKPTIGKGLNILRMQDGTVKKVLVK